MKSRKLKWYLPRGMQRAGKSVMVFDTGLAVYHLDKFGKFTFIGHCKRFAITRDRIGIQKELAKLTADLQPERMQFFTGIREDETEKLLASLQERMDKITAEFFQ